MNTDPLTYVEKFIKAKSDLKERLFEWQLFQEERLEAKLQSELKKARQKTLDNFDNIFVLAYEGNKKNFSQLTLMLSGIKFDPRISYTQLGQFRFKRYTFPQKVNSYFSKSAKDITPSVINVVGEVNYNPFADALDDSVFRSYNAGGQSVYSIFDVKIDFALRDLDVESWLKNYEIQLAQSVSQEISSKIKFELLEGIRNSESITELRNRVTSAWNKPIDIVVPPKLAVDGTVIRQGYQYQLSSNAWATTVARTEVSRAFASGKLEGYAHTKVVEKVEWMVTPDERLCPSCSTMDGQVFTLEQAQGMIPLHGNCRCTWVPILVKDKDYDTAKKEAQANIEKLQQQPIATAETAIRPPKPEESHLVSDKLTSKKDLGGGCNETFITKNDVKGVFKPVEGEMPHLRQSCPGGTYYKREVASYKFDHVLGFDMVPPTVVRTIEGNVGSHQLFKEGYKCWADAMDWRGKVSAAAKNRMNLLDYLLGHEDRHFMNFMINSSGDMIAIDNGLALGSRFQVSHYRNYWAEKAADKGNYFLSKVEKGVSDIWEGMNWKKMEQLKIQMLDSGLLEEDAFMGMMGRIKQWIHDDRIEVWGGAQKWTSFYENKKFSEAWDDLKSIFREAGKL